MSILRYSCVAAVVVAALGAAACSENPARSSITAPTASITAPDASGATSSTTVIDRSSTVIRDGATLGTWAIGHGWAMAEGLQVEGTDVITAKTGTCPDVVITVRGVPVTVNSATVFGTGIACADLAVNKQVKVTGLLTYAAGVYSVVATKIENPPTNTHKITGDGTIESVTGTCPTLTVTVRGVAVKTDADTTYVGGACADLAAGTKVSMDAETLSDNTYRAETVRILEKPGHHGGRVAGEGTVSSVSGTCPTLTLVVQGYTVKITSATTFTAGACTAIRAGVKIEAAGVLVDTTLTAETVAIKTTGKHDE